jgi:polyphosphate kinase
MSAAASTVSIGDRGVLNQEISLPLSEIWLDRDLGWLDFNDRVLAEALDQRTPLLERAKFLAIFTSNLDEFFMKRVSALRSRTTLEAARLLTQIHDRLVRSLRRQADCYRNQVVPELAERGILLRRWDALTPAQQEEADRYFDTEISAALTPLVFDPAHPFPFLSNLSTSLAFLCEIRKEKQHRTPALKCRQFSSSGFLWKRVWRQGGWSLFHCTRSFVEMRESFMPGWNLREPHCFA